MKARDIDTLMSIVAVLFVVGCFFVLHNRAVEDIIKVGVFIACPTKFIAVARLCKVIKGDDAVEVKNGQAD